MENKWTEKEFDLTNLEDERLKARLIQIADSFLNFLKAQLINHVKIPLKQKELIASLKMNLLTLEKI